MQWLSFWKGWGLHRDMPDWSPQMGFLLLWDQMHFTWYLLQVAGFSASFAVLILYNLYFLTLGFKYYWNAMVFCVESKSLIYLFICLFIYLFPGPSSCWKGFFIMFWDERLRRKSCVIPLIDMSDRLSSFFYPVRKM